MGAGAVVSASGDAGYHHLLDPTRTWKNNKRLIRLNAWIVLLLITSSTNGFDGSMMNGLQALPQWITEFNHPNANMLGILSAIQVRFIRPCFIVSCSQYARTLVRSLLTRSLRTCRMVSVVRRPSSSVPPSCVSRPPSRPPRRASACSLVLVSSSALVSHLPPTRLPCWSPRLRTRRTVPRSLRFTTRSGSPVTLCKYLISWTQL
jgi:hypothetical protein